MRTAIRQTGAFSTHVHFSPEGRAAVRNAGIAPMDGSAAGKNLAAMAHLTHLPRRLALRVMRPAVARAARAMAAKVTKGP